MDKLTRYIESLIFASPQAITIKEISDALNRFTEDKFDKKAIEAQLREIKDRYQNDPDHFMELVNVTGGYQFMTKVEYNGLIHAHLKNNARKKLSRSAMETLAIIAYKQPVTKPDMEQIRGVSCDYAIQKLLEKEYVSIVGRADSPGMPILYTTSEKFMDHFGLESIKDLPTMKELKPQENEIGEGEDIEVPEMTENENGHGKALSQSDSEE